MKIHQKTSNKSLSNQTKGDIKKIIHYDQVDFIPEIWGWFNISK